MLNWLRGKYGDLCSQIYDQCEYGGPENISIIKILALRLVLFLMQFWPRPKPKLDDDEIPF